MTDRIEQGPADSRERLEAALRAIPAPDPPARLEARLIAAIPPAEAIRGAGRRTARLWLARGLALAAALALAAWIWHALGQTGRSTPPPGRLGDTSPRFIGVDTATDHSKETRPCDIFPPLPF
jgi:hypothetical protein